MLWSDVQANVQYRILWEDMRVNDPNADLRATKFRDPSFNSNGNSFDFQGRQISTQDFNRRVIREHHRHVQVGGHLFEVLRSEVAAVVCIERLGDAAR